MFLDIYQIRFAVMWVLLTVFFILLSNPSCHSSPSSLLIVKGICVYINGLRILLPFFQNFTVV